ncbi:hypothetical protein T484DRAFT_1857014 [Baffinella frigidus]|nr:hypothetical protein T484DRAFT_1857014 [Cryptophyta sp. CCMP2293]
MVEVIRTNAPSAVAVAVVHNKLKKKEGELPPGIVYISGEDVPAVWNCYPWDAAAYGRNIDEHEELAHACAQRSSKWGPWAGVRQDGN